MADSGNSPDSVGGGTGQYLEISMIRAWPAEKLADELVRARGQLLRVTALADELKATGIVSVYESALELGEMIEEAING